MGCISASLVLQAVWPGLPQVSPLFFLFVPTEGGVVCGNRLVELVPSLAWVQSHCMYSTGTWPADLSGSQLSCLLLCSWKALPHTARAALGASSLHCCRSFGSYRLWSDMCICCYFVLTFGRKLVAQRKGRATKCQTQQWPSDSHLTSLLITTIWNENGSVSFPCLPGLDHILVTLWSPDSSL